MITERNAEKSKLENALFIQRVLLCFQVSYMKLLHACVKQNKSFKNYFSKIVWIILI